jgi:molecular chaperone DnaJ
MTLMSRIWRAFARRGDAVAEHGVNLHYDLRITLEEAFAGTKVAMKVAAAAVCESCAGAGGGQSPCPACGGDGRVHKERTLNLNVPAGIEDGTTLRLGSAGEAGTRGAPSGDIFALVQIMPHKLFWRDGANLFCRVPIQMTSATSGGAIVVPLIDGGRTTVYVPAGTRTSHQFCIKSKGMSILRSKDRGDLVIETVVETSANRKDLSEAASFIRDALRQ